jgi:N-methylhydantoinase A
MARRDHHMLEGPIRVAVDIGGTFTDLQVLEERSGRHLAHKTPTTPSDPSEGLVDGLRAAAARFGFELGQVTSLMHGTTIATNAVLEGRLARGALVTTRGFRDVLEIGRHVRHDVYAAMAEPRRLLVERARRFEVTERIGADGTARTPLDEDDARAVAGALADAGVETVAVCLLHAYANPGHEQRLGAILRETLGEVEVSLSHEVSPEIREFERTSTTVLNALLMPVVRRYLERLRARLAAEGFEAPVYLVQSNGGVTTPETAARLPARLLLSGPSGGALAARTIGARLGAPDLVAVDMGGTSFDVSIVHDGEIRLVTEGVVDGCPVRLPMVEIRTIGAGGGSVARVDAGGRLRVGPESAGAEPGPAAYGRGAGLATVTDANVVLGRLDPGYFLGGAMRLDADAAFAAVDAAVARPLGLDVTAAAEGVLRVSVASMAAAIRLSLFEKGLDPKDFALVSFGGAGGLHAAEVAEALGARRVVYPRDAGTLSAWGILFSDLVHDLARSRVMRADAAALELLRALALELLAAGEEALADDRVPAAKRACALALDMRYPGQAYEIVVPLEGLELDAVSLASAVDRFHAMHAARYAHAEPEVVPEIVTVRLTATGVLPKPRPPAPASTHPATPKGQRAIWLGQGRVEVPVHDGAALSSGARLAGPAIVEDEHSTILVPAGWALRCAPTGDRVAERAVEEDA